MLMPKSIEKQQKFQEWYLKENALIREDEWNDAIKAIYSISKSKVLVNDEAIAERELSRILLSSLEKRLPTSPEEKIGIMFSGGIDSTLIAFLSKKLGRKPVCFSVGIEESEDLQWAEKVSFALKLELFTKIFTIDDFEKMLKEVVAVLGSGDAVKTGIGCVTYAAMQLALSKNIKVLFSGLGSEEVFAGYERHLNAFNEGRDVNQECLNGLYSMYERDLLRDARIAMHLGVQLRTPFLDKELIEFGMRIAPELKINTQKKKIILRKTALGFGIPEEIAFRKKRAAQYGSGFDRAIEKLAKLNSFRYKADYMKDVLSKIK